MNKAKSINNQVFTVDISNADEPRPMFIQDKPGIMVLV